jgi:hypothetical protein
MCTRIIEKSVCSTPSVTFHLISNPPSFTECISWLVHEKSLRVPVSLFHAGFVVAGQNMEVVEAECMVANMIHKGYIRGYISHEKQMVVLAKTAAFPAFTDRKIA